MALEVAGPSLPAPKAPGMVCVSASRHVGWFSQAGCENSIMKLTEAQESNDLKFLYLYLFYQNEN